ncbi:Gypsy retrotransposon integrase-like protein 1 [Marasmius sp. AFHP31]|nr:Gypsy retrotransposon integrase-like protein 1 [Marasmius sp. AFHP31]
MAMCSNATRKTIHILETLQARLDRGMIALEIGPDLMISLFVSALILLVSIWRQPRTEVGSDSKEDLRDVYRCIQLIQRYEPRYQTAGRLVDVLNAVIQVGQLPRTQNSLKRPRRPDRDDSYATSFDPETFDSQTLPEDLRGSYTGNYSHESAWHHPLDQPGPLSFQSSVPLPLPSSTSYPASVLPSMRAPDVDLSGPPSGNLAAANDYMSRQPDPTWYPPASSSSNIDITYVDLYITGAQRR